MTLENSFNIFMCNYYKYEINNNTVNFPIKQHKCSIQYKMKQKRYEIQIIINYFPFNVEFYAHTNTHTHTHTIFINTKNTLFVFMNGHRKKALF